MILPQQYLSNFSSKVQLIVKENEFAPPEIYGTKHAAVIQANILLSLVLKKE